MISQIISFLLGLLIGSYIIPKIIQEPKESRPKYNKFNSRTKAKIIETKNPLDNVDI